MPYCYKTKQNKKPTKPMHSISIIETERIIKYGLCCWCYAVPNVCVSSLVSTRKKTEDLKDVPKHQQRAAAGWAC